VNKGGERGPSLLEDKETGGDLDFIFVYDWSVYKA